MLLSILSALALATPIQQQVDSTVHLYRNAIVLAAAVGELSEGQRRDVPVLGKFLLEERRHAVADLTAGLVADVPAVKSDKAKLLTAFLDAIEADPDLRDGDKLVFRETLRALQTALAAAPSGKRTAALLVRVGEDLTAIAEIEQRYRDEMTALMGKLRTRGMRQTREAWDAYLAAIEAQHPVDAIFSRHASELSSIVAGTRATGDNALEIYGTSLPDKTFVLTFDDGPHPEHTATILDELERRGVKAVFFEVGRNVATIADDDSIIEKDAALHTRRIVADGHLLASHSWSHKNLPKQSDDGLDDQLDFADRVLEEVSGGDVVLMRPPYGGRDGRVLEALQKRNTRAYLWNIDSMDWADPVPESIAQTVYEQATAEGHGVILLHDVHEQTAKAVPLILDLLERDGYRLVLWDGETIIDPKAIDAAPAPEEPEVRGPYAKSWAVVIGINDYESWPRLAYAVHDAAGIRDKLIDNFGFDKDNIIGLFDADATRDRILEVLGDDLPARVGPEDRVFVFYAGHGATRDLPTGSQRGYIVPVDADMEHLQSQAISMSVLQDIQEAISAKHMFFVMDACYSGIATTRSGGYTGDPRRYLNEVTRRHARQILTAGGATEQVADHGPGGHSIFTWTLLQGLDGPADLNGDGVITGTELSSFVGPKVSGLSSQTPSFGNLVGSAGGEFVFTLDSGAELLSGLTHGRADAGELEKAQKLLEAQTTEMARMQEELARLRGTRGSSEPGPKEEAQRLHAEGLAKYREGELSAAYEALRKAAQLDGADVEIVNNLGFLLQQLGAHDQALPWIDRAIELEPDRAVAYLNRGDSLKALGKRDEAVIAYRKYLEMVPTSPAKHKLETYLAAE